MLNILLFLDSDLLFLLLNYLRIHHLKCLAKVSYITGTFSFIYYTRDYSLRFRIRDGQYRQTSTTSYPGKRQRNQNIYAQMGEYQRTQKSIA